MNKLITIRRILCIIGAVVCVFGAFAGKDLQSNSVGYHPSTSLRFGADFYTESYQATADAAYNVAMTNEILVDGLGYLLIFGGLAGAIAFICKALSISAERDDEVSPEEFAAAFAKLTAAASAEPEKKPAPAEDKPEPAAIAAGKRTCPECQTVQPANREVCYKCGLKFEPIEVQPEEPDSEA